MREAIGQARRARNSLAGRSTSFLFLSGAKDLTLLESEFGLASSPVAEESCYAARHLINFTARTQEGDDQHDSEYESRKGVK